MARFQIYAERDGITKKVGEAETREAVEARIFGRRFPEGSYPIVEDTVENTRFVVEGPGEWYPLD